LAAGSSLKADALMHKAEAPIVPLVPPAGGVPVAFLLSDGAVVIDFAGPWEVFEDAHVTGGSQPAGLSAGIDLALHVVARYYGKEAALQTAYDMEYEYKGRDYYFCMPAHEQVFASAPQRFLDA
jgi:YHS domain-containing protein